MAIDEVKFGELIGTVGALVTAVAETKSSIVAMKDAIIPALKEARAETAAYREEARLRAEKHEAEDRVVYEGLSDALDWMRGDGTDENPGARRQLNALLAGKTRLVALVSGIGIGIALLSHGDKVWLFIEKFL